MSTVDRSGQPGEPDYRLTVYPSTTRLLLITIGALAFVIGGIFMSVQSLTVEGEIRTLIIGILATAFFGLCLIYCVAKLFARKPALVLDNSGVYDNASAVSAGFIAWNDIKIATSSEFRNQRTLAIAVTDPEALLTRISGFKRLAMRANIKLNGQPVNLPQAMLPIKVDELEKEINHMVHRA